MRLKLTLRPAVTIGVTKTWDDVDDHDGIRPAVAKVQLFADGEPWGEAVELSAGNRWGHAWRQLPKYQAGTDVEIAYEVREVDVPAGYTSEVDGTVADGFTVVNSHIPRKVTHTVTKIWDDDNVIGRAHV